MRVLYLGVVLALCATAARADDDEPPNAADPFYRLDTKNLFGALEGADVGEAGDRSVELETTPSLFRRFGRYAVVEQEAIYEITPTPKLGIEFGAHALGQSIHGVGDPPDYAGVGLSGVSNEWRYVLMPRGGAWGVQATATITPQAEWLFEGGARGRSFSAPLLFILDAQPIARRLYAALNLSYQPELTRLNGEAWTHAAAFAASAALSWRLTPAAMIGAEADEVNLYDSFGAAAWRGSAFFLGPTFHYQINDKLDLSGAWTQQLAGRGRGDPRPLNLADFTRSQAKLRLEIDF